MERTKSKCNTQDPIKITNELLTRFRRRRAINLALGIDDDNLELIGSPQGRSYIARSGGQCLELSTGTIARQ